MCQRISSYKEKMLSGIIVTGGAARIPDLTEAFGHACDLNVRIVKGMPENVTVSHGVQIGEPDRLYTLYSLLLAGKENCVGELAKEHTQDTFDFGKEEEDVSVEPETQEPQPEEQDVPKKKQPSSFSRLWRKIEDLFSDESDGEENS